MSLSRIDYLILTTLKHNNATSPMYGNTIKELEIEELTRSSILRHLNKLQQDNLLKQEGKSGSAKMYYITETGLNILNNENKSQEN